MLLTIKEGVSACLSVGFSPQPFIRSIHTQDPRECAVWGNLARWWCCNNKLYILACNIWTVSLRNTTLFFLDSVGPGEAIHMTHTHLHLNRFTAILNFVQICLAHLWTNVKDTFLDFWYSIGNSFAVAGPQSWLKCTLDGRVDMMFEWPWQIWCHLANRWRCYSIIYGML